MAGDALGLDKNRTVDEAVRNVAWVRWNLDGFRGISGLF